MRYDKVVARNGKGLATERLIVAGVTVRRPSLTSHMSTKREPQVGDVVNIRALKRVS